MGGEILSYVHWKSNQAKAHSYLTGFFEGILASGHIEQKEVEPLLAQCKAFFVEHDDADAYDILQDFEADLLEADTIELVVSVRAGQIDPSCQKSSKNRFLGFCAGVACDGLIAERELKNLISIIESNPDFHSDGAIRALHREALDALADGMVTPDESESLCNAISRLVGDSYADTGLVSHGSVPVFDSVRVDCDDPSFFEGAIIVLTGSFSVFPRRKLEDALREHGAEIAKSVTKKTTYVVVASEASRDWVEAHKGTKLIKAMELAEKLGAPELLSEGDVLRFVGEIG